MSPRGRILLAFSPARPRPATPLCAPTRPARGMSVFWTRQFGFNIVLTTFDLAKKWIEHGQDGTFSKAFARHGEGLKKPRKEAL